MNIKKNQSDGKHEHWIECLCEMSYSPEVRVRIQLLGPWFSKSK